MCVTNTVNRRSTLSLSASAIRSSPSMLSQRLCNSILGDIGTIGVENHAAKTTTVAPPVAPTISTSSPVPTNFFPVVSTVKHVSDSEESFNAIQQHAAAVAPTAEPPKRKRKRKRKPQLPGKTAKMNDRHFVVHNYHDHAQDTPEQEPVVAPTEGKPRRRGGVAIAFPLKLHSLLDKIEEDGLAHVVSWQPHGRAFVVHKPREFAEEVMPKYFRQTKITSFQRQLNLYGFNRITKGRDNGGYYHELFLRGKVWLSKRMTRTKVKGTGFKAASSPDNEPDFYKMPFVTVNRPEIMPFAKQEPVAAFKQEYVASPPQRVQSRQFNWVDHGDVAPQNMAPVVSSSSSEGTMEPEDVLEDAVNEMMVEEASVNKDDLMLDFAHIWNPERTVPAPPRIGLSASFDIEPESDFFGKTTDLIENDAQLGQLLEALLK